MSNTKSKMSKIAKHESSDSDNDNTPVIKTKKPVKKQPVKKAKPVQETDNDTSDSDNDNTLVSNEEKKQSIKKNDSDSDESVNNEEKKQQLPVESDSDSDASSDDNVDDPTYNKKIEKKTKLTTNENVTEIHTFFNESYKILKEIDELETQITKKKKEFLGIFKKATKLSKLLPKSISDDLVKCRKEKPKRKGNGGFKKETVPDVLCKYLEISNDEQMTRPQVYKILNNKFKENKLKHGKEAILDEATCKALGLKDKNKTIGFSEFMGFIGSFYPSK